VSELEAGHGGLRRERADAKLDARVASIHRDTRKSYGRPHIAQPLRQQGECIGWSMSDLIDAKLVCAALRSAYWQRKLGPGLLMHTVLIAAEN